MGDAKARRREAMVMTEERLRELEALCQVTTVPLWYPPVSLTDPWQGANQHRLFLLAQAVPDLTEAIREARHL